MTVGHVVGGIELRLGELSRTRWIGRCDETQRNAAEPAYTLGARRQVLAQDVVGSGCDLHDQVVGPLELGHDPQHGEQETEI